MVLAVGDAREIPLADESVQCCITSPPYWGLRDYGLNGRGIGLEASPDEYVAQMVAVFREVRRVLRRDGTVWLNLGDSYFGDSPTRKQSSEAWSETWDKSQTRSRGGMRRSAARVKGLKPKDLVGIPWRVALALQADGWWLRSDVIWHKPNPMPEAVTDRPTKAHEYVFLLAKSKRYYYDAEAVREAVSGTAHARHAEGKDPSLAFKMEEAGSGNRNNPSFQSYMHDLPPEDGRNKRSVWAALEDEFEQFLAWKAEREGELTDLWTITPQPYKGAHFATFPVKLVEPMVLAGTSAKGCCPECGKAWERVVEKGLTVHDGETESEYPQGSTANRLALLRQAARARGEEYVNTTRTTGWRPGCDCSEVVARDGDLEVEAFEPVPCTVLDPFGGTMTVGEVCAKHGRRFVGLDLKREYVEMGWERCATVQTAYAL